MQKIIKQIVFELKRDKKKAVVLAVLFCVAAVVIGKLFISDSQPAPADAAPAAAPSPAAPVERVAATDEPTADESEKSASRDKYLKELDTNIKRDVFKPTPGLFPSQRAKQAAAVAGKIDDDNRIIFEQSKNLSLQSTVFGATPTAIVNNKVLKKGDMINGFLVVEINPSSVLMEKNGSKVLIWMKEQSLEK